MGESGDEKGMWNAFRNGVEKGMACEEMVDAVVRQASEYMVPSEICKRLMACAVELMKEERYDEAKALLEAARKHYAEDPFFVNLLLGVYAKTGKQEAAYELFDRFIGTFEGKADPAKIIQWANSLMEQNEFEIAKLLLEKAREAHPRNPHIARELIETYYALGKPKPATAEFNRSIEEHFTTPEMCKAISSFMEELNPDGIVAWMGKLLKMGFFSGAEVLAENAIKHHPGNRYFVRALIKALGMQGGTKLARAGSKFYEAVNEGIADAWICNAMLENYKKKGDAERIIWTFKFILEKQETAGKALVDSYTFAIMNNVYGDIGSENDVRRICEMAEKTGKFNAIVLASAIRAYGKRGDFLRNGLPLFYGHKDAIGHEPGIYAAAIAACLNEGAARLNDGQVENASRLFNEANKIYLEAEERGSVDENIRRIMDNFRQART
nr:tetratricopeptide repeat protein [Candidatus Burarchaeum sp.]